MKKRWKILLGVLLFFLLLPYVLPVSSNIQMDQPFDNSEWIKIEGVSIHTRVFQGESVIDGKKILLIHGLGGSTFSFRHNVFALTQEGYTVVAVDLPAFGFSDRNPRLISSQENRAVWLWGVLNHIDLRLGNDDPWVIMGHSMGASVAIAMEEKNSASVLGLIFIDGAVVEERERSSWANIGYFQRILQVALHNFLIKPSAIESFLSSAYGRSPTQAEVDGYLLPLTIQSTPVALSKFVSTSTSKTIDDIVNQNIFLGVLWGEEDAWIPVSAVDTIQQAFPQAVVVVFEGEGHCPNETAETFNEELISMLRQLSDSSAYLLQHTVYNDKISSVRDN